jgi:hypothetical protein
MNLLAIAAGGALLVIVLWDAFETVVLPRRASFRLRLTKLFYRSVWPPFAAAGRRMKPGISRENFLSVFGPLSLILLLAAWAVSLVFGFALLQWGFGSHLSSPTGIHGFGADLYMSGTNFFTLGLGDVAPTTTSARILTTVEAGMGFAFLALVIGFLPVLSQAFSRRESAIALLDARAGSPPTAAELLRRHSAEGEPEALGALLTDWERWSAEVLESHISFPVLAFYRSQHDNQSWVASMTAVLDVCAFVRASAPAEEAEQARLTFAIARHALMDMCRVFQRKLTPLAEDRLPPEDLRRLRESLVGRGDRLASEAELSERLGALRRMYEPAASALSKMLLMPMPPWLPAGRVHDNWMSTL